MKKTFEEIINPGGSEGPPTTPVGDDWLSRVNSTISNFKELIKLAQEFRGAQGSQEPASSGDHNVPVAPQLDKAMVLKFLDSMINRGFGDATIAQIIEQASPFTIKRIRELITNA